jgi:hypothetical protein
MYEDKVLANQVTAQVVMATKFVTDKGVDLADLKHPAPQLPDEVTQACGLVTQMTASIKELKSANAALAQKLEVLTKKVSALEKQ